MRPTTEAEILLHQAIQVYRSGNRSQAYDLLCQAIQSNNQMVLAWLWMSELVDRLPQKRKCLERVLAIDPDHPYAHRGMNLLRLREVAAVMKKTPSPAPETDTRQRLGAYLIERRVITAQQLDRALNEQRLARSSLQGSRVPLGDILIAQGLLTPHQLATILVEQQQDRIGREPPALIGEYLIERGIITPQQFQSILEEQIQLHQRGKRMLLGELLIRAGYVTQEALEALLEQQQNDVWRQFEADSMTTHIDS